MVEALLLLQGACTHGIASAPAFGVVYKPAHHGSARPAVLRALSCNAVVVAWLYPAAAICTGCALCAVRCPFDAIRMVRTQPLIEDVYRPGMIYS